MGWFSNLFSGSSSTTTSRRNMALSTHDAFSLPTTSPIFASHPDTFHPEDISTPDPDAGPSPSYAYPPQSISSPKYDYVPTMARSRPASLLPLHNNSPMMPRPPYPPLAQTWTRLRTWLSNEYPELGDTLNWGILPQDLADVELAFGFGLPPAVRESYLLVDGQEAESSAGCSEGLFFGLTFLPLEDVLEEWRFWREVDEDPATGANERLRAVMQSIPPGWVRRQYSLRGWIPLITDKGGNYLGIDLNPDEGGSVGQVIVFGRDFDTKVVMWRGNGPAGWAHWLSSFAEELESREGFEVGATSEGSDGSEDDVGYESYFFDGSGRQKGEGGGDAGTGGLKYTGEYKGWNVLEAWADRSLRRWEEAGLLPEQPKEPEPVRYGLGVGDVAAGDSKPAAEVGMPAVEDKSDQHSTALSNVTNRAASASPRPPLPTISVTKPPAPLPVSLPSPRDFTTPSPPNSRPGSAFDRDLEAGAHGTLTEMDEAQVPFSEDQSTTLPETPTTPVARRPSMTVPSEEKAVKEMETTPRSKPLPDLLRSDSLEVANITAPIEPSPSSPLVVLTASSSVLPTDPQLESPVMMNGSLAPLSDIPFVQEMESEADQTIRLVGGGGMSGVVASEHEAPMSDPDTTDAASISSVTSARSSDSSAKLPQLAGKKHKKEKSLTSGLMKLGKLAGGKRKSEKDKHKDTIPATQ